MKQFLIALLLVGVIHSGAFAKSYIDRQLKETKRTIHYNTADKFKQNYNVQPSDIDMKIQGIKDPGLIKLSNYSVIKQSDYEAKLAKDEETYRKKIKPVLNKNMNSINIEPAAVDFYKVYRVAERLIRANGLDYVNWRIAVRKSKDFNAASFEGSYIEVNTGLYDALYTNEDALAFVLAHEMGHLILGHGQQKAELLYELARLKAFVDTDNLALLAKEINTRKIYAKMRFLEYMADTEAINLLVRAGYSPYKAKEALNFMDALGTGSVLYADSTHPKIQDRIASYNENLAVIDPDWVYVGRENIYKSDVLNCKKSSDRVSIILNKSDEPKTFYAVESAQDKLKRIAYRNYVNGNFTNAIKYFKKLSKTSDDFIAPLYLSCANEMLFKQTVNPKYLKAAKKAINKAMKCYGTNPHIIKQVETLNNLENL